MGDALQAIVSLRNNIFWTFLVGALRREARGPFVVPGPVPGTPVPPTLRVYQRATVHTHHGRPEARGSGGQPDARIRIKSDRRMLAYYHNNPSRKRRQASDISSTLSFFYFFVNIQVEKKSTIVRRWRKLPKISKLRAHTFGRFKCALVYVQYGCTAKEKCAEIVRSLKR